MPGWGPTEWMAFGAIVSAAAAVINIVLVFVLVAATIYYARQTRRTVDELREARVAQSLPVLHWQRHGASRAGGNHIEANLMLVLTSFGPGPARLVSFDARSDQDEDFTGKSIAVPSTLRSHEPITVTLEHWFPPATFPGRRAIAVRLRYADLDGLRTYETRPSILAHWTDGDAAIDSADYDERSPAERRITT